MESIKNSDKFVKLESDQMKSIFGGANAKTVGGSRKNGPTVIKNDCTYTPMQCWDSDYINNKGQTCYEGLSDYTEVTCN